MSDIDNLFGYNANKILPIIAAVVICVSGIGHSFQNSRYKYWRVTFFMFYASVFYAAGWIFRAIATRQTDNLAIFIIQSIFIYLAPPIYSAAEYNTLERLMHYLPMHAFINPNRIVYIFMFLGAIIEVLTSIGASWMAGAQGKDDRDLYVQGATLISISVVLQGVVELAFISMVAALHYRCARAKMVAPNVRTVFIMLYGTSLLIIVRCVFRTVESFQLRSLLSDGHSDAALLRHEWPLYVFETIPVVLYTYWINIIHPGRYLPSDLRQYLDFDGKTERFGPGWIHNRAWWMYVADPFDFIGMTTMKKRDEFYLEPERWPVVEEAFAQGKGSNVPLEKEPNYRKVSANSASPRSSMQRAV